MFDFTSLQSGARTGASVMDTDAIGALNKALSAGYGTDVSTLTGGAALRVQSLDTTMQSTIQENDMFKLFNKLPKPKATATVDEWTEQSSVGGFLGGSTNSESGNIAQSTGSYARRVGLVKYLMTQRQVTFVQTLQGAIADSEGIEQQNGALQLLSDANYLSYEGDANVVPTEFDGVYAQIRNAIAAGTLDGTHIIDMQATPLKDVAKLNQAQATVRKFGNFGRSTDLFMSMEMQADFDTNLDPAFRVPLTSVPGGGIMIGSPVRGIRTSGGEVAANDDVFIRSDELMVPWENLYSSQAQAQSAAGLAPSSVTCTVSTNSAQSMFNSTSAGTYYYYVTGINAAGQSQGVVSSQVAVAVGGQVSIAIAAGTQVATSGFVIYRSRVNGGNKINGTLGAADGISDFREMCRIPITGATTTYVDVNRDIPGCGKAYVLNLTSSATAILWRQLLPMLRFNLYPTQSAVIPWAQLLFGYLRISKLRHHVVLKNVLPNSAAWRPFNV